MNAPFDTLTFSKRLEDAGLSRPVSEALSTAMQDIALRDIATKSDLDELANKLTMRGIAGLTAAVAVLGTIIRFA